MGFKERQNLEWSLKWNKNDSVKETIVTALLTR